MTSIELLLSKLSHVKPRGKGWIVRCPAHDDRNPSLSITEGQDGRILIHCHAGCKTKAILSEIGWNLSDLTPDNGTQTKSKRVKPPTRAKRKTTNNGRGAVSDNGTTLKRSFHSAHDAEAELARGLGPSKGVWPYQDAEGKVVFVAIRFALDPDSSSPESKPGQWLEKYLEQREDDLKPASITKLVQTRTKLLVFFGSETLIESITPSDGSDWRRFLKELGLSEATIKSHSGNAKTIMAKAVRQKILDESPFTDLKSGPTPCRYTRYITPDEIQRVIDACPDAQWRLLFGLARYAGLRIPSESHLLTWADVDFDRGRLTVKSPKTEHHAGHEQRIVPITSVLMPLIQDRFDTCVSGEEHLITINGNGALIRPVRRIWKRAGVEPWKRLWQTQRQSCEKQWAMSFPQFAVSKWIGHSITISGRHYANDVPDELLDKAADYDPGTAGICGNTQSSAQRIAQ